MGPVASRLKNELNLRDADAHLGQRRRRHRNAASADEARREGREARRYPGEGEERAGGEGPPEREMPGPHC